jgi:hypothetical protein
MKQQTLTMAVDQNSGFEQFRMPTRRDEFLSTMNTIVPWSEMCAVIEPFYPKGVGGRPPIGLERMLHIHFVQHWFNLADRSGPAKLNSEISGNSGHEVGLRMVWREGVIDGEEIGTAHPPHAQSCVQGPSGVSRIARRQADGRAVQGVRGSSHPVRP